MAVDFYSQVPKKLAENIEYRLQIRRDAMKSPKMQRAIYTACSKDVLFFLNAMCWLYEPRPMVIDGLMLPTRIPFITWAHQDEPIRVMREHLGHKDIGLEKSRAQGASWIGVMMALHDWLFVPGAKVSLVSSTEKKTDDPEDPDSLFWKIDWQLKRLPLWLAGERDVHWKRNLQNHTLVNLRNDSRITGYACTSDIARGGRARWFLMDELASWPRGDDDDAMRSVQQVTKSRLLVSTPEGKTGAYYRAMHEPSSMVKLVLDWKDNPWQNRGLYRHDGEAMVPVDPIGNPLPDGYESSNKDLMSRLRSRGFPLAGELRSPWYDAECDRTNATPQSIAKELDRDYGGSMYRIFGADFFARADKEVRGASIRGQVSYNPETLEPSFDIIENGPIHLWTALDAKRKPPKHQYVIGADICSGLGGAYTSNSVACVIDLITMEQVLEYATNIVQPQDFADQCIALAKLFNDAYLIWEHNGPGAAFTMRVKDRNYPNYFLRNVHWKKGRKKTKEMGWWTDERSKELMFGDFSRLVRSGEFKVRSRDCVRESGEYVRVNGKIVHVLSATGEDDSSKGQSHGDRVIAIAVCLQGVKDRPIQSSVTDTQSAKDSKAVPGTMAWRQKEYEKSLETDDVWDDRENWELLRAR